MVWFTFSRCCCLSDVDDVNRHRTMPYLPAAPLEEKVHAGPKSSQMTAQTRREYVIYMRAAFGRPTLKAYCNSNVRDRLINRCVAC